MRKEYSRTREKMINRKRKKMQTRMNWINSNI